MGIDDPDSAGFLNSHFRRSSSLSFVGRLRYRAAKLFYQNAVVQGRPSLFPASALIGARFPPMIPQSPTGRRDLDGSFLLPKARSEPHHLRFGRVFDASAQRGPISLTSMVRMSETMAKPKVAILGLGIMGSGMANRLLSANFPLAVYNRHREKCIPFASAGAYVAAS